MSELIDDASVNHFKPDDMKTLDEVMAELGYDLSDPDSLPQYRRSLEYDAIDALPAGPELDKLVLEAVGYKNMGGVAPDYWRHPTNEYFIVHLREFNPSEDIEVAMQVLDIMHEWGWALGFEDMRLNPDTKDRCWWYELYRWDDPEAVLEGVQFASHDWELDGGGATMQECICHAALKVAKLRVNG